MPSTRHVSREQPYPAPTTTQSHFTFPANNHLLITTASHVHAWDSIGIHTIFKSSKSGIVAAKEAKDGSGVLAIADKHVVVLHDTKRGQERSLGLEAEGDEVRHLEYTADAKSLFLSTNLTTDIQHYSIKQSRLLSPAQTATSPPTALAISPTGHLLVSAAENPPVAYIKHLAHNSPPILIESRASETPVSTIAFHPERPNIFLLGFKDGTLSAFDATKISNTHSGAFSNQQRMNAGELSHLRNLHRTTSEARNTPSIADAAFIPGYRSRAVTVGSDGRCRLVDFSEGGVVLRTWHAKAPVTSVSVLSRKPQLDSNDDVRIRASHTIGGPTSTNNLLAIGRADGKVHMYDSVGLLLSQITLGDNGERILSVEWAKGASPTLIMDTIIATNASSLPALLSRKDEPGQNSGPPKPTSTSPTIQARRETMFEHIGLPPALRLPKPGRDDGTTGAPRKFTIHPDEVEGGTVRRTPASNDRNPNPVGKTGFFDLFSPVKPLGAVAEHTPTKRIGSPPRSRPRISPQTFVKHPQPALSGGHGTVAEPRNLALFPSTDSSSDRVNEFVKRAQLSTTHRSQQKVSALAQKKLISFKPTSQRRQRKSINFQASDAVANHNAKVLADIRQMSAVHPAHRNRGVLSAFESTKTTHNENAGGFAGIKNTCSRVLHRSTDHIETELDPENALEAYENAHRRQNWPEDSNQHSSLDGDIWLTSDSDDHATRAQRRRRQPGGRPPARQTSRSHMNSKGTMSTLARDLTTLGIKPVREADGVDGSTDEAMFTAGTHISPSGAFSPSSNDVRQLFPRSSSLSPRKRQSDKKKSQRTPPPRGRNLREVAANSLTQRQPKSPWDRAKASRKGRGSTEPPTKSHAGGEIRVFEDTTRYSVQKVAFLAEPHCDDCLPTATKVHSLEGEVARLKGEVLALKAALRRNGVTMPMLTR